MNIYFSYNVFDNEELLESSIKNIRNFACEITVIFQNISNFGVKADPNLLEVLNDLKNKKLVDNLVLYNTQLSKGAQWNELQKNNLGYEFAKKKKADYYSLMACDEFYFEDEYKKMLDCLNEYPVDLVTSYMYTYYKSSNYRFKEIENYVVPILNKVYQDDRRYVVNGKMPLLIDPLRTMEYNSCFCFPKQTPLMHHLSHVRKDFRKKLENSSAKVNWLNHIEEMVKRYESWKPGQNAYLHGKEIELEYTNRFKEEIIF